MASKNKLYVLESRVPGREDWQYETTETRILDAFGQIDPEAEGVKWRVSEYVRVKVHKYPRVRLTKR